MDLGFALAALAAFLVGLSKGGLPAIGMLAVPLLSLQMPPVQAAVLLLPVYVLSDMVGVWLYRRAFSAANVRLLIPAGIFGVWLGWMTASQVSDRVIGSLIGLVGLAFVMNAWLGQAAQAAPRSAEPLRGWFWGTVAGFTSFISHAGAPPFQMFVLPQKLPKAEFAGTATIVFAVINAAKILPYQQLRPYTLTQLQSVAWVLPAALLGTVVGAWLTRRMDTRWFYRLVQLSLLGVSLQLLWKAAQG